MMEEPLDPAVASLLAMVDQLQTVAPVRSSRIEAKLDQLLGMMPRFPDHFVYVYNISEGRIVYHNGLDKVLGYSREELSVEELYRLIHPEDAPIVAGLNEALIRALIKVKMPEDMLEVSLTMDYRMRKHNGEYLRVMRQSIVLEIDELSRKVISTASLCKDISSIKQGGHINWQIRAPLPDRLDLSALRKMMPHMRYRPTTREMDVIRKLAEGKSSKIIAHELRVSEHTVAAHRRNLLQRTGLKNTAELVSHVKEAGWL